MCWLLLQSSGIWQHLHKLKPVHCEPRGSKEELDEVMKSYFSCVDRRKGAVLLAVCRGKVIRALNLWVEFEGPYVACILRALKSAIRWYQAPLDPVDIDPGRHLPSALLA